MTKRMNLLVAAAALTTLAGCSWFGGGEGGGGRTESMDAGHRFLPPPVSPVETSPNGVPMSGYIPPDETRRREEATIGGVSQGGFTVNVKDQQKRPTTAASPATGVPANPPAGAVDVPAIPDVVREQVNPASASPRPAGGEAVVAMVTPPTVRPTTGVSTGSYMTLGGVVAEVNQRPIYANQVLREIVAPLSARAKDVDEQQFRKIAYDLIDLQIKRLANAEREVAVADRNLDEKEKDTARFAAARWRQRQITEAGGSLEMAKRKWAAEGYDFEDRVDQEYRNISVQLYYSKKVWPRVQVTADEIRQYYNQHLNDEFTDRDQVRFRLIKVDPARTGGREAALNKAKDLRARAARGEDFAAMASGVNDDKLLMSNAGDVGWVQKGAYANEQVEKAVWNLQPGEVSDIIDTGKAFYVAKLEERKLGRVIPFDEQAVQDQIQGKLRSADFARRRDKLLETLAKNSVLRTDKDMVNTAVDMAMQNYPRWHGGGETVTQ